MPSKSISICKQLLKTLIDDLAKHEPRKDIFKRHNIPSALYNKAICDTARTNANNPYHPPADWIIDLTNDSKNYTAMEGLAALTGGVYIRPDQVEALINIDPIDFYKSIEGLAQVVKGKIDENTE